MALFGYVQVKSARWLERDAFDDADAPSGALWIKLIVNTYGELPERIRPAED